MALGRFLKVTVLMLAASAASAEQLMLLGHTADGRGTEVTDPTIFTDPSQIGSNWPGSAVFYDGENYSLDASGQDQFTQEVNAFLCSSLREQQEPTSFSQLTFLGPIGHVYKLLVDYAGRLVASQPNDRGTLNIVLSPGMQCVDDGLETQTGEVSADGQAHTHATLRASRPVV